MAPAPADPVAVDTSVAVPLLVASHSHHAAVTRWARSLDLRLSGHAAVETYSVLTRLPGDARVEPRDAIEIMDANFSEPLLLAPLAAHRELARAGVAGGAVYDGLVALAAREHGLRLATRDSRARTTYEVLGISVELVV
ncbi:MAG: PIN domain-containing protein [Microbacterium sp.]|jgi:predicted nucleic acid-binding protein|uniref:PIN domain-containing protein n=1 Tax=Microbacterium sp. TaxID=51671 RepID=UPI0025EC7FEA|nr:PIN domain-containing protein [Microbacterium sp.]MBQ9918679.1 PIN domain-containing protein [Microbacterium sp.]